MFRRLAAVAPVPVLAATLLFGPAVTASAQTTPPVQAVLECGPVTSDLVVTVTSGAANASYTATVNVDGVKVSVPLTTNVHGVGTATLPVLTSLLDLVTSVQVTLTGAEGTIAAPVADVCGLL